MIERTVRHIYSLLQDKKYIELEAFTNRIRMSSNEIKEAISEYGRELVDYPLLIEFDAVEVKNTDPKEWSVVAPIYTREEGISDLSMELSLTETEFSYYRSELDNIRVR